ncbi:hypothetical protein BGX23_003738 [Mortierella sp. AD031]|nr:hypothetical protein BGX23_003738 [Mortierella sp. AD031]
MNGQDVKLNPPTVSRNITHVRAAVVPLVKFTETTTGLANPVKISYRGHGFYVSFAWWLQPVPEKKNVPRNLELPSLLGFLELFGFAFDYNVYGFRVINGGVYIEIAGAEEDWNVRLFCEDPLDPSRSTAKGTYNICRVRGAMRDLYVGLMIRIDQVQRAIETGAPIGSVSDGISKSRKSSL